MQATSKTPLFDIAALDYYQVLTPKGKIKAQAKKGYAFYLKMVEGGQSNGKIVNISQRKINPYNGFDSTGIADYVFWKAVQIAAQMKEYADYAESIIAPTEKQAKEFARFGEPTLRDLRNALAKGGMRRRYPKKASWSAMDLV